MNQLQNRQAKFATYFSQKNDYLFFAGVRAGNSIRWTQVYQLDGGELVGLDFQRHPLAELDSWLVAYPRTGEIVDCEGTIDPLPAGVTGNMQQAQVDIPVFTLADLNRGREMVEIEFSPSPTHPKDAHYYSTRLINRSLQRVRCLLFGGFRHVGGKFHLGNVTGRPFTEAQFAEWYAVGTNGWLPPDGVACDPTNYGSRCHWVYYFQTESGERFHAGREVRGKSLWSELLGRFVFGPKK